MKKDKIIYLTQQFKKDLPAASDTIDSINIEGYANTTQVDRVGDIIPRTAWDSALVNYLKNPIILAYHEDDEPIGRMIDHRVDDHGLWIKARISAAAEDVFNLVKDGVLTAFSVGFMIKDATYDAVTDLFIIKELELLEISVVAVPCNQDSTFSLSKAFDSAEDYSNFKSQFTVKKETAKELDSPAPIGIIKKEWNMDPKELEQLLAKAANDAAEKTAKAIADKQAAQKAAEEAAAAEDAALNAKIVAAVKTTESGAEKLLADIEKRFADQTEAAKVSLAGLEASIKEKADELDKIQKSKMSFTDKANETTTYADRETAVLLSKIMSKSIADTKFGHDLIQKTAGTSPHDPSNIWEREVSFNMENEIRARLVVASLPRQIQMKTNVMMIPVNPEAGVATWIQNSEFGTTASPGSAQTHQLKEITLNAYKVSTAEYMNFEEEEDSLLILLPIVRDAMIRRVANAVDKAYLLGLGNGSTDPVKGFASYDATSVVYPTNTGVATISDLRALRADLGLWGLNPAEVTYIVSTEVYYNLLDDTTFQTMNAVGPQATLLTGQVGQIGNSPVLVSAQFPSKTAGSASATTNYGAIALATGNFIAGNQRGLRFDTQDLVETQRRVLVASMRTGMVQMSTVNGQAVSALRWK